MHGRDFAGHASRMAAITEEVGKGSDRKLPTGAAVSLFSRTCSGVRDDGPQRRLGCYGRPSCKGRITVGYRIHQ